MLYEIQYVKQNPGEPRRRWFVDDYFDLIVWLDGKDDILGFQLCYDKLGDQHALTWHREKGYMHHQVDDGEGKPGKYKAIPVLVADGPLANEKLARIFNRHGQRLETRIYNLVYKKILAYTEGP